MNRVQIAYRQWWNQIARQGDPIRRPDLSFDAFSAGWEAGKRDVDEADERRDASLQQFLEREL